MGVNWYEKYPDLIAMLESSQTVFALQAARELGIEYCEAGALFNRVSRIGHGILMLAVYVDGHPSPAEMSPVRNGFPRLPHRFESIGVTVENQDELSYDLALVTNDCACHSGSTTEAGTPPQGGSNGTSQ